MGKGGDRVDSVFKKPVKAPKTLEKILVGVLSATPVSTGSNPVVASHFNLGRYPRFFCCKLCCKNSSRLFRKANETYKK